MIKKNLKALLNELEKVQTVLVLDYSKRNDRKIFHSSTNLIAGDSDIAETFQFMHQSIMSKIKNYACEDCIVLRAIIKHSIKIFSVSIRRISSMKNWDNKYFFTV